MTSIAPAPRNQAAHISRLLNAFLLAAATITVIVSAAEWARQIAAFGWPGADPQAVLVIFALVNATVVAVLAFVAEFSLRRRAPEVWFTSCVAWVLAWPLAVLGWGYVTDIFGSLVAAPVLGTLSVLAAEVVGVLACRRLLRAGGSTGRLSQP